MTDAQLRELVERARRHVNNLQKFEALKPEEVVFTRHFGLPVLKLPTAGTLYQLAVALPDECWLSTSEEGGFFIYLQETKDA